MFEFGIIVMLREGRGREKGILHFARFVTLKGKACVIREENCYKKFAPAVAVIVVPNLKFQREK